MKKNIFYMFKVGEKYINISNKDYINGKSNILFKYTKTTIDKATYMSKMSDAKSWESAVKHKYPEVELVKIGFKEL